MSRDDQASIIFLAEVVALAVWSKQAVVLIVKDQDAVSLIVRTALFRLAGVNRLEGLEISEWERLIIASKRLAHAEVWLR